MTRYQPVIGLEVHAQIHTKSKMFCGCPVAEDTGDLEPNTLVCPVCMGMPGVLPVVNNRAVDMAINTGLALHCDIPRFSRFARKSYFYPDLPKGYQISQYALPVAVDGYLAFDLPKDGKTVERRIRIRRAHLEEDAAKLHHRNGATLVDLNRAGMPLLEIVSEPDLRSAEEARAYGEALREILIYLGVNSGDMERGVMRFEANVSVRPAGSGELGARHEVKNLNSFRALFESVRYEIEHQIDLLEEGDRIQPQTVGWDETRGVTVPQRGKEFAPDYRYFPEPDIPPLELSRRRVEELQGQLPELPRAKRHRFREQFGLTPYDADLLVADKDVADYFEQVVEAGAAPKGAANWITGELFRLMKGADKSIQEMEIVPADLAALISLVENGTINQSTGKDVLEEMLAEGRDPQSIVAERGLSQISDTDRLGEIVVHVLDQHPQQVEEFLSGKEQVLGWFIGQVMRATRGKANPQLARDLLTYELETRRK